MTEENYEEIWKDAEECYEELKKEEAKEEIIDNKECKHINIFLDIKTNDNICEDCGIVVSIGDNISQDWSCYKDDTGNYSKSTQRGDSYGFDSNPYSIPCTMIRGGDYANPRSLAYRLQIQLCFNHKQKTCWEINKKYEHICGLLNHTKVIPDTANNLWYECLKSGKLTRASVRNGLIAICYYYACLENKIVTNREKISKAFECKNLNKGEKVFCSIIENVPRFRHLTRKSIDLCENNSFIYFCNKLGLEFKIAIQCNDFFLKNKDELKIVTPKSATGGVLTHIVKNVLKLKVPTKTKISTTVGVCTPTLNKVLLIIEKIN